MTKPAADQKPTVLVALRPTLYADLFVPQTDQRLRTIAAVTFNSEERTWTRDELAARVSGFDVVVTGWGTPDFDTQVLAAADRLRLIVHSAGSVKHMVSSAVFSHGIQVSHAAAAIAPSVAETSLLLVLLCLRPVHSYDRALRAGQPWQETTGSVLPRELAGERVGVIGAGHTGRHFIALLQAFRCDVWVADPYLSTARAHELGVVHTSLDEVLRSCRIVSLQAPVTRETERMIGVRELGLLQDGACLINTARSRLVDENALVAELRSGRIRAALDVFDDEPLPTDSPFRTLPNVILTPHIAGASRQARQRQGDIVVAELERFFSGQPLHYPVIGEMLATMA